MNEVKSQVITEAVRRYIIKTYMEEKTASFYIFRTDTNATLAKGIVGYEAAKEKANQLRKQYKLKWNQVSFKMERKRQQNTPEKKFDRNRYLMSNPKYASPQRDRYSLTGSGGSRAYTHHKDWDE